MPESKLVGIIDINKTSLYEAIKQIGTDLTFKPNFSQDTVQIDGIDIVNTAVTKCVLFGELDWIGYQAFVTELSDLSINILGQRFVKPTATLSGAVCFVLADPVSEELKLKLNSWADTQGLEVGVVTDGPDLELPGLIVMDMDSTAIQIECIDEIAILAGVGEEVSKVTEQAMRGELDFSESLRARVKTLTDAPVSVIDSVAQNLPLMPGLEELVAELKLKGWKIVIASGGFTYMTEVLKLQLGLDKTVANQLEMHDGKLTGQVLGEIVDAQVKADTVLSLSKEYQIPLSQTVAMGDGANDLVMMEAANLGVAFHAKPLVRQKADVSVKTGGLDQLLYLL